jgi:predicted esterase
MPDMVHDCRVEVSLEGRYLVRQATARSRVAIVGYHGYAETADTQLARLLGIPGTDADLAVSVQGLHPFYRGRGDEVVAHWMTRADRERAIDANVRYVGAVLEAVGRDHGLPPLLVHAGFSQGAAMAFRAALLASARAAGVISVGGDVPPELAGRDDERWTRLPVLLCRGLRDEWYTAARMQADAEALRARGADVRPFVFDGGHEWHASVSAEAGAWLRALRASSSLPVW